ncbi:MAG: PKD domain-containing protein [Ferruginibacter sp.]
MRINAYYNECGAPSLAFPFKVIGVIADFSSSNTCTNKNTYLFSDSTSGIPTSRLWEFGDGVQLPGVVNPVHAFPVAGQFNSTLSMDDTNTGCSDRISKVIYTAVPTLYTPDSAVCRNSTVSYSILNDYTDTSAKYTWNIMGSQSELGTDAAVTVNADSLGVFNNFFIIDLGPGRCPDTVRSKTFFVRGPRLDFASPGEICSNTPLSVINNSKPFIGSDTVLRWDWNFGGTANKDTAFQPKPFRYASAGEYDIRLIAVDKNGCTDTLSKPINVSPSPFLHLTPQRDSICAGQTVTLTAVHNNNVLAWSPSTGLSCTNCDTTIATPLISTKYYATATNSFNCSITDSSYIEVNTPFTATIVPGDIYLCLGESATLEVNPKGKKISWSPAAGLSNPAIYNPILTATQNTSYTASLSDSTGCARSTAVVNVHVKPLPQVDAGPDKFYSKGEAFSISPTYSTNISSYFWTPAGSLSCDDCPAPAGVANNNQKYIIKVVSDSGCTNSDSVAIWVDCKSAAVFMPKAFTPDNNNLNDFFYPVTAGINSVARFTIYNRQGQVVYEARNFSPNDKGYGWDGKFRGVNQSMGAYLYTMEIMCETGEKISKRGSFLLVR